MSKKWRVIATRTEVYEVEADTGDEALAVWEENSWLLDVLDQGTDIEVEEIMG